MKDIDHQLIINTAKQFGTPTYLYQSNVIKEAYQNLTKNMAKNISIFYSMKANPTLGICQLIQSLGAGCEVSSKFELLTAIKAGFDPSKIIFVGPGKSTEEIELAIRHQIKAIICESMQEIITVNNISKHCKKITDVLIRINPDFYVKSAPIKMSGVPTQFGFELKTLNRLIRKIRSLKYISIEGIQVYNASRVLDEAGIIENISNILLMASELQQKWDIKFKIIDIGGGFGVPYFKAEKTINLPLLCEGINLCIKNFQDRHSNVNFILELGRYLVAESGCLITTVQYTKTNHEKKYLIVDAGLHCLMAAAGLGSFIQRNFPIKLVSKHSKHCQKIKYQIVGTLCTPGDVLARDVDLPEVKIGDYILICHSGAYGLTASLGRFLSHGSPSEVIYHDSKLCLLRRRELCEDIWCTQVDLKKIFQIKKESKYAEYRTVSEGSLSQYT